MLQVNSQKPNTSSLSRLFSTLYQHTLNITHHGLALIGLLVLCAAILWIVQPDSKAYWKNLVSGHFSSETNRVDGLNPATALPANNIHQQMQQLLGLDRSRLAIPTEAALEPTLASADSQAAVSRYLSRKYRVSANALDLLVSAAYAIGHETQIDPSLLLAVMAVESGFNPFAESVMGAQGLMQVMSKVHRDKLADFGGARAALNPVTNIKIGALILKDCIRRAGSLADGLRLYVGSSDTDDGGYSAKILQEKERIQLAARNGQMQTAVREKSQLLLSTLALNDSQPQKQNDAVAIYSAPATASVLVNFL